MKVPGTLKVPGTCPCRSLFLLAKLLLQDILQGRLTDLLQLVTHAHGRFIDLQDARQINRRADDDQVDIGLVDGHLQVFDLGRAVTHGRQDRAGLRIFLDKWRQSI